jgi:spore coat polysaccharide biosynthesis protein SpsF
MNFDIYIPIRLDSKRLPKKALLKIKDKTIVEYLYERMKKVKKIRKIIICTTNEESDKPLVEFLKKQKIEYFCGSKKDILIRYLDAANKFSTDFIINVDGDDIYTDPKHINLIINEFEKSKSNFIQIGNVPLGFTSMGFSKQLLEKICRLKKSKNTETGWIRFFTETNVVDIKKISPIKEINYPKMLRLSLDYKEDYDLAKDIFEKFKNEFEYEDIINYIISDKKLLEKIENTEKKWNDYWDENLSDISLKDI